MKIEVLAAIDGERAYQEQKWPGHTHTTSEWLLIIEKLCVDARRAWVTGHGDNHALHEIRQITATGVACLEQCGAPKRGDPVEGCQYPETVKSAREKELEDLLASARAIAERKGEGTAWERFSERLAKAGISSITPRTFRVLPLDSIPEAPVPPVKVFEKIP